MIDGIEREIAGLERNIARTEIAILHGDDEVRNLTPETFPLADVWRARRAILVAKQKRRRERLACLLKRARAPYGDSVLPRLRAVLRAFDAAWKAAGWLL